MEKVEVEHNGVKLVGEVLGRDKWSYGVKLIEPFEAWSGGCHIPTFGRDGRENKSYEGERGDEAIKYTLTEIYERAKIFFSQADRYQRIYDKAYLVEIEAVQVIQDKKIREQIENKLKAFIVYAIERSYGDVITIWEQEWMLDYLKRNSKRK